MTEQEAVDCVAAMVTGAQLEKITRFVTALMRETDQQNLISASTMEQVWSRHVLDSLQLQPYLHQPPLLDIGTGAGFPGVILAIATGWPTTLCEPRARRVQFLEYVVRSLDLPCVQVAQVKSVALRTVALSITARAVAPPLTVIRNSLLCSTIGTRWILPVGRTFDFSQMQRNTSEGLVFHVEQSITDPTSSILLADRVR